MTRAERYAAAGIKIKEAMNAAHAIEPPAFKLHEWAFEITSEGNLYVAEQGFSHFTPEEALRLRDFLTAVFEEPIEA
jgi:hypothetical protein